MRQINGKDIEEGAVIEKENLSDKESEDNRMQE